MIVSREYAIDSIYKYNQLRLSQLFSLIVILSSEQCAEQK